MKPLGKAMAELLTRVVSENKRLEDLDADESVTDCIRTGQEAIHILEDVLCRINGGGPRGSVQNSLEKFSRLHLTAYFHLVEEYYRNARKGQRTEQTLT